MTNKLTLKPLNKSYLSFAVALLIVSATYADESRDKQHTPFPTVSGVVVDEHSKPIAGVKYWTVDFISDRGDSSITMKGVPKIEETDSYGRFSRVCATDGAITIVFEHPDFAPTWLTRIKPSSGPLTVRMDPGVEVTGEVKLHGKSFDESAELRLDIRDKRQHQLLGGFWLHTAPTVYGDFNFRLPTDYWKYSYQLDYAYQSQELHLPHNQTLPHLVVETALAVRVEKQEPSEMQGHNQH